MEESTTDKGKASFMFSQRFDNYQSNDDLQEESSSKPNEEHNSYNDYLRLYEEREEIEEINNYPPPLNSEEEQDNIPTIQQEPIDNTLNFTQYHSGDSYAMPQYTNLLQEKYNTTNENESIQEETKQEEKKIENPSSFEQEEERTEQKLTFTQNEGNNSDLFNEIIKPIAIECPFKVNDYIEKCEIHKNALLQKQQLERKTQQGHGALWTFPNINKHIEGICGCNKTVNYDYTFKVAQLDLQIFKSLESDFEKLHEWNKNEVFMSLFEQHYSEYSIILYTLNQTEFIKQCVSNLLFINRSFFIDFFYFLE